MNFNIEETIIPGCKKIFTEIKKDDRGIFVKTYHKKDYLEIGLGEEFVENYYTISHKNVLRGMHYQALPFEHSKIVNCMQGSVFDVVLDLRRSSPMFGKYLSFELSERCSFLLYIPKGCAHGFYTLENNTIMYYKVSTLYAPEKDMGIKWDSFNCEWPIEQPLLSKRDITFPKFSKIYEYFI